MNKGEFENLKIRFGDEVARWPAPFRQEASAFLDAPGRTPLSDDEEIDRLVLKAAIMPTDERVLIRHVMGGIAKPKRRMFGLTINAGPWSMPATATSIALVITLFSAGGYVAADKKPDIPDDALLAFAAGVAPLELAEMMTITQEKGEGR
ncbi:hypothetical protein [Phyllobacterium ifriqiyense]|uniref:hypothetical protein n=1 Tax=Phyllobacterium ifriqiyense TaxID=314238 RepID=UPI0033989308